MNEVLLRAENVYFSYDDEREHALNGLSVEIRRGRKVAVMGANGSGKSTFFLCCNGIHKPTQGTLYYKGKPIDYSRKGLLELRSEVGIVFQEPDNQLFSASVYQEISFGILNMGVSEDVAKDEVEKVIEKLGITPFRNKPTHALSGGQKKQVAIADILVMKPEVIILDEPVASLDPKHTAIVNDIINQLTEEGITVIMSIHDVNYAWEWADDILLFHEGHLLKEGSPEEVFVDGEILERTNLVQPMVMRLYHELREKHLIEDQRNLPKTVEQLMGKIEN